MATEDVISATLRVKLKPWSAPSFAARETEAGEDRESVHVSELSAETLEAMALAWLRDLYRKAEQRCPFSETPKAPAQ